MAGEDIFGLSSIDENTVFGSDVVRIKQHSEYKYDIEIGSASGEPVDINASDLYDVLHGSLPGPRDKVVNIKFSSPVILHGDATDLFVPPRGEDSYFAQDNVIDASIRNLDTSNVTNMSGMFSHCMISDDCDFSGFDTSNVTNMSRMFFGAHCPSELDVSSFDTSNVTDMSYMFSRCSDLRSLDLSGFKIGKDTDTRGLCEHCASLMEFGMPDSFDNGIAKRFDMLNDTLNLRRLNNVSFVTDNNTVLKGSVLGRREPLQNIAMGIRSKDDVSLVWDAAKGYPAGQVDYVEAYKVNVLMDKAKVVQNSKSFMRDISPIGVQAQSSIPREKYRGDFGE